MPTFVMRKKDQKNLLRVLARALLTKGSNVMSIEVRPVYDPNRRTTEIVDGGHTITVTFYDRYWNKKRRQAASARKA